MGRGPEKKIKAVVPQTHERNAHRIAARMLARRGASRRATDLVGEIESLLAGGARVLATESTGDDPWPGIVPHYCPATGTYAIQWCGYSYTTKGIPGERLVARPAGCPYPHDEAYIRAWCSHPVAV
jgi:hypothetical protein